MKKQAEMLAAMNEEERQAWAVQRLRAYFRSLRLEGYKLEEIAQAALVCGGGALAALKGTEDAAAYLTALAYRIIEDCDPLPEIDGLSGPKFLM